MDILVVSPRADLWQNLRPQFEKHGAALRLAPSMDEALSDLTARRADLVVLDINADAPDLRHAVFRILYVSAMIHTAAVTTMSPETRILRQVTIESAAEADRIFSMLMGDEVPPRREFIERNAHYANIDA